jgi:hypothetical protein
MGRIETEPIEIPRRRKEFAGRISHLLLYGPQSISLPLTPHLPNFLKQSTYVGRGNEGLAPLVTGMHAGTFPFSA